MQRAGNALTLAECREWASKQGFPVFRGNQLFHYFHIERKRDILEAHVLPKAFRERAANLPVRTVQKIKRLASRDGSAKYLLALEDGAAIETVFMPYADRTTLCVSTQVGCRMGCTFCASTKADFGRNLQAEEILAQVYRVEEWEKTLITRIVLMGIGEPMDNLEEVLRFIHLVTSPEGKNLSERHITLSTCGIVPGIHRLMQENLAINLAISLHATSDERRRRTMPIARRYTIAEVLDACDAYFAETGRRISFEYALIQGENDREEDVQWMSTHLVGPQYHVNLIPLNTIEEFQGRSAKEQAIARFAERLEKNGVHVSIRQKRGADIDAACGQLRVLYEEGERN